MEEYKSAEILKSSLDKGQVDESVEKGGEIMQNDPGP